MTKPHTKGPWMLSGRTVMEDFGPGGCGRAIATVVGDHGSGPYFVEDPEEKRANASLIAAAPELLEALEVSASLLQSLIESQPPYEEAEGDLTILAKARAAIAKATRRPQ